MYETEVNIRTEAADQIPANALAEFARSSNTIASRTLLPWGEHCTECAAPGCYSTCDLYAAREDGKCRRFMDGMVRIEAPEHAHPYILKIRFKRWGQLFAWGNLRLHSSHEAKAWEARDRKIGQVLYHIAFPGPIKKKAIKGRYFMKKRRMARPTPNEQLPDFFLIECYNPSGAAVALSFSIRAAAAEHKVFQKLVEAKPGYNSIRVPVAEITPFLDLREPFKVFIIPNDVTDGATLYFGVMDFVRAKAVAAETTPGKQPMIKCVVWDLDNTLWDGILVEDGIEKLRLKPGIADILSELDRRGILLSIASKNHPQEAEQALKKFGIDEYFLYPQISWGPKSEGVKQIAKRLNISADTFLFVDDSEFERAEVLASAPAVRVLDASEYPSLLERGDCAVPVTADGSGRRQMYKQEAAREATVASFNGDYMAFLRHAGMTMNLKAFSLADLERVHELTQRTNQMNFSGNRYAREVLKEILNNDELDAFVIDCKDRFGSYGTVGFSIVNRRERTMTDLMFSCRIQSKRVEHAFMAYLVNRYGGDADFYVNYRKNSRNAPAGKVFDDLGFEQVAERDGVLQLLYPRGKRPGDEGIVNIVEQTPEAVAAAD